MNIWALTDNRIGNTKQTLALAEVLGNFQEKKVRFTKIAKLPNKLLGRSLVGVTADFSGQKPDIIISAGRKLARVALALKKKHKCKAIHIMYPGKKQADMFDFVIVPSHDKVADGKNIIKITGAICKIDKPEIHVTPAVKQVTVLVGNITEQEAQNLAIFINNHDSLYYITTSRRTNAKALEMLEKTIKQPHKLYKFGSKDKNPYDAFVKSADILIVTGDSVNMCTEAAHTGKPLYIMEVATKPKFRHFWEELYDLGIARPLAQSLETWEYTPLDNLASCKLQLAHLY